jgi:hydroxyacylglutathione hydrolase
MALFDVGALMPSNSSKSFDVVAVPTFDDNYVWLIHDGTHAAVVDPGEAAPVAEQLKARRLTLTAILLTHRHDDHIGGVSVEIYPYCRPLQRKS